MFIAEDLHQFKTLFVNQLKNMLADDEPGAFILVLANSLQDEYLKNELADDLKNNFSALKKSFNAGTLEAPPDDADVFKQLLTMHLDDLPVWQSRQAGSGDVCWEIAFNVMRQLRPARASKQVLNSIIQPFDENRFHFNKPFLKPEILWQGNYLEKPLRVLYNKFPFAPYHLLIAVAAENNCPQVLDLDNHDYIFSLLASVTQSLPGFGVGYNSLAAGASVNHLHFQGFVREPIFSIERSHWKHNGGDSDYPLTVKRFSDQASSWKYIEQLTAQDMAYNCLYRNGSCYVIPRQYQGTVALPGWLDGAGWIDVAGVITVSDMETFDSIDESAVTRALCLLKT